PRRFSQLPTSFFASCRLGIHRVPFVAWSSLFLLLRLPREDQGPAWPSWLTADLPDDTFLPTCAYAVVKDRKSWWSRSGSNRRHPACKTGALPAELRPRNKRRSVVGLGRFELPTPRLSSVCSNQLSYRPSGCCAGDRSLPQEKLDFQRTEPATPKLVSFDRARAGPGSLKTRQNARSTIRL